MIPTTHHIKIESGGVPADLGPDVRSLELRIPVAELPPVVGKLKNLRRLAVRSKSLKRLPDFVFDLPRLTHLDLRGSGIEALDGVERLPWLHQLDLFDAKLGKDPAALKALAKTLGGKLDAEVAEIVIKRTVPKPPTGKPALIAAIKAGEIHDWASLAGADLSGAVFEGVYLMASLKKANLKGSTWKRCAIPAELEGADLEGATFEACAFSGLAGRVKANRASFRGCVWGAHLMGAELEGARFSDPVLDTAPRIDGAKASAMQAHFRFSSAKVAETEFVARGADLRGATIKLDLAAPAKATTWPPSMFEGCTTDAATRIELAGAAAAATAAKAAGASLVDPKGPRAEHLGQLAAPNEALWFLAVDAGAAAAWTGGSDSDPKSDWARARKANDGGKPTIAVGKAKGVVCDLGEVGWANVYAIDGGVALLARRGASAASGKTRDQALGLRVAQLKAAGKPIKLGAVEVTSRCLALLVPSEKGDVGKPAIAAAAKGPKAKNAGAHRLLVPLANGTYDLFFDGLGKTPPKDELGTYEGRLRIVKR
jgi:uncharacterized protein YjbI with pentapeptide repeats